MTCSYCRSWNSDEDHRCRRCGRRLTETDTHSDPYRMHRTTGALAAAPAPVQRDLQRADRPPVPQPRPMPLQGSLFAERQKIIPFASIPGSKVEPLPARNTPAAPKVAAPNVEAKAPARRRAAPPADPQPSLDFLPSAPHAPRTLRTSVEAVIYCDAPVATPMHRAVAAALDLSMIWIAFGLFLLTFHFCGGDILLDRITIAMFGAGFALVTMFYGLLWVLTNSETAGMRWARLKLTNFDGFPPDRRQRALRYVGTCLSVCAAGVGLLWSLVDEESLTWQDHISKTFPTFNEPETNFVRRRR